MPSWPTTAGSNSTQLQPEQTNHKPASAGVSFDLLVGGDDMTEEQFTAFLVLLAAVSVPSVSLLFAGAWELWRYSKRVEP